MVKDLDGALRPPTREHHTRSSSRASCSGVISKQYTNHKEHQQRSGWNLVETTSGYSSIREKIVPEKNPLFPPIHVKIEARLRG